ncbi:MAG: hypothetical protein ACRDL7_02255, partial [Gaiellaceae bacterium]
MIDPIARAEALGNVLTSAAAQETSQPFAEAAVACCIDLIRAGEPARAVELSAAAIGALTQADRSARLRLAVVHARALMGASRFADSLAEISEIRTLYAAELGVAVDEDVILKICHAANLWQTNRGSDAVTALQAIRQALLARADSFLLGWCSYQLSAAETVCGNYESARRYALDAVVSGRRCSDQYLQGIALSVLSMRERALCRWDAALECEIEGIAIAESAGYMRLAAIAMRGRGITLWKLGRLKEAEVGV